MNSKGELSTYSAPIVAIDYKTIFSKKPTIKEYLMKSPLDRTFRDEFKELTLKLFNVGFNVYIVAIANNKKSNFELDEVYYGKYLYYTSFKFYSSAAELAFDCRNVFSYFICERPISMFFDKVYSLSSFKELL